MSGGRVRKWYSNIFSKCWWILFCLYYYLLLLLLFAAHPLKEHKCASTNVWTDDCIFEVSKTKCTVPSVPWLNKYGIWGISAGWAKYWEDKRQIRNSMYVNALQFIKPGIICGDCVWI